MYKAAKYSDFVRVIKVFSYATDRNHNLHGFLCEDSEGRGAICAHECAHITLERAGADLGGVRWVRTNPPFR